MEIREKIRALLAKAQGTNNEHEADAFIAKANELLEKFQLTINDIMPEEDKVVHSLGRDWSKKSHAWFFDLYRAVAVYYGCQTVREEYYHKKENGKYQLRVRMNLIGRQSAIITTDLMFPYLFSEVNRHARRLFEITGLTPAGQANRVGAALVARIWAMMPVREEARTIAAKKNALMTVDAVRAKLREVFPSTESVRASRRSTDELSREAAASINLARQAGRGSALKQLR